MTQHEKILKRMIQKADQEWFYAYDFMQPTLNFNHPYFVGYEVSARISELVRMRAYKDILEVKMSGKYRVIKIKDKKALKELKKILNI